MAVLYPNLCYKYMGYKGIVHCFQDQLLLNVCHKYCRMLQGEHSAILLTFIKLSFVNKIVILSTFEWSLKTGFTVYPKLCCYECVIKELHCL